MEMAISPMINNVNKSLNVRHSISLGEIKDYKFDLSSNGKMITSSELMFDLVKLAPFGEMPVEISSVTLSGWSKQTIETVGQEIRNQMSKQQNPTEWFVDLVKINYIKKYRFSSNSSIANIANYSNCSKDTIANNLRLVRRMIKKVNHSVN